MSTLRQSVADYLQMRQTMGFKAEGLSKLLGSFVSFCEARGVDRVRNDVVLQWATAVIKVPVHDALFARRMDAVRIFAKHQHALDPATQIPPETAARRRYQPREPNVFTPAQITALMAATAMLSPQFRALTWRNLIGLLAATGMRPGEACRLSVGDIDLAGATIKVLATKFDKSRLVFLHPSTVAVLEHYLHVRRDWAKTDSACPVVFLNTRGGPIDPSK